MMLNSRSRDDKKEVTGIMFIKGFDENLCCRGMQFEIGKTYNTGYTENLELCSCKVFHFCKSLEKVHEFYSAIVEENNRFCEIEVLGELVEDESKCGSNKIKILREITGEELAMLRGLKNGNTGLFNTGDMNTGNWNTGMFNACDRSTGLFNTEEKKTVPIFNKDSGLTWNEIYRKDWYEALRRGSFKLTEWIWYTEEEMKDSPIRQAIQGYLKQYTFEEACLNWWDSLSSECKELIKTMPNFDAEIFKEITRIEVKR